MHKQKQALTWPLSILVIAVSFLSVLAVFKQVDAAWLEPTYLPSDTSVLNNFVFTPLVQNLDLGSKNITGNGNISIVGNVTATNGSFTSLTVNGIPVSGGGGGTGSADWAINYAADRALYFATTTGSGNVGIGTTTPNKILHLYSPSPKPNAELDIQSVSGSGNHWGIYHDASTDQLRFWKGNADRVVFYNSGDVSISRHLTVSGNLTVSGTINGASGGASTDSHWLINTGASNALYYTTTTASGYVGIGTATPNKTLHLYSTASNAELDIQSVSGSGNHWAMYHDAGTDQLRFWKSASNNVLTLGANGRVAVGTTPDNSNMLRTLTSTVGVVGLYGENTAVDFTFLPNLNPNNIGVKGVANNTVIGGVGVYGSGYYGLKGLGGNGGFGVYGEASGAGAGIYGIQGAGSYAAKFDGNVQINGDLRFGTTNFLYMTNGNGAPTATCSALTEKGKLYVDMTNSRLYICINGTWKYSALN